MSIKEEICLYTLDTQARANFSGAVNRELFSWYDQGVKGVNSLQDVVDIVDNLFLHHDGTVTVVNRSKVGKLNNDIKPIVQIRKYIFKE